MKCFDAEERLHELLDCRGDISADVHLQNHLSVCDDCRQMVDEYSLIFGANGSEQNSAVKLAHSEKPGVEVASNSARFRFAQTAIAIALTLLLFVLPAAWSLVETNRIPDVVASTIGEPLVHSTPVSNSQSESSSELLLSGVESQIDIAAVLNIGHAFNSISLVSEDSEGEESVESEQLQGDNSWDRLIASVFPPVTNIDSNQMPLQGMPWQNGTDQMSPMNETSLQNMLRPIEFKQPTFKEILRVCSNPFSQS